MRNSNILRCGLVLALLPVTRLSPKNLLELPNKFTYRILYNNIITNVAPNTLACLYAH